MKNENDYFFPVPHDVEKGKCYHWCRCHHTTTSPLCDKNHCMAAITYCAQLTETVYFCGCKLTKDPPLCDGSHGQLLRDLIKKSV